MAQTRLPYIQDVDQVSSLDPAERLRLKEVGARFKFRTNDYYNSLIDWNDPNDPLRLIVLPHESELEEDYGALDASAEAEYTVVRGLQHKYAKTGLMLVSKVCAAYCRFCFRKRLFFDDNQETTHDLTESVAYIRAHEEIESLVLSGGDPMLLSTPVLARTLKDLAAIPHVKTLRIDTKILAFNPFRVSEDQALLDVLGACSKNGQARIYMIAHYTHPKELTPESERAVRLLQDVGVSVYNQMPLLKGVNADAAIVADLSSRLAYLGVTPYYVFIPRPVMGNKRFALPLREAWEIYRDAISRCSGIGKTAKLVMSHRTGKIEVVGFSGSKIVLRYHQAPDLDTHGSLIIAETKGGEMWADDLDLPEMSEEAPAPMDPILAVATRAAKRFDWYRELLGSAAVAPLLTREILDRSYYSAPPREGNDAYLTSGSSTGQRRRIEYSRADQERYLATKARVFGDFLQSRSYAVTSVVTDVGTGHAANTAAAVFGRVGVTHRFVQFDQPIEEHLAALREAQPQVIYTMPSILEALIKNAPDPRQLGIKGVILVGESAGPHWINSVITGPLGIGAADVMDTYGSIEIGLIAYYSHAREAYVVVDDIVAEVVSPEMVGVEADLRPDEAVLVVTSRVRDEFPAVRFVTYDVVRGFRAGTGDQPSTFQSVVRRIGNEFKHGEKISLHDIEEIVYRHLTSATIRVRTEDRRVRVFISSDQLDEASRRTINDEIEQSVPEIGIMIANKILDGVEVLSVSYADLPQDPVRLKQRLPR